MNKVKIKVIDKSGKKIYVVQAISISKNGENLFIPSPFGTELMSFDNLNEAKNAVKNAGYEYSLIESKEKYRITSKVEKTDVDYDRIVDVFIKNLGHENLEIRTSAINSLSKFGTDISDKLIEILSTEHKWLILQSAINCIEKIVANDINTSYLFIDSLIKISDSDNTMIRSAALKALEKICDLRKEE